jgi:tRNA pseudouridine13 synthase
MNNFKIETPRAFGEPLSSATFRKTPEDFIVNETLIFKPDDEGEHVYLYIKKRNTNTQWLAGELARFANLKPRDVSYAGLKDRNAVTCQWFSLLLHKDKEPDWKQFKLEGVDILQATRHRTKLRPGMARKNQFIINLHDTGCDEQALQQRLRLINQYGVPNYYGEQRFGHNGNNLEQARAMFEGEINVKARNKKGLYLSAARSYLFNKVLAERVRQDKWYTAINGDCMMLDGSNSFFAIEQVDKEIMSRVQDFDIHPSGPLWGKGRPLTTLDALQLENEVFKDEQLFQSGLEKANMKMDRRALRMKPIALEYAIPTAHTIMLTFDLNAGQYATTLLHELFILNT